MHDGGADAIGPGAAVEKARRGEGPAAELLGVEAEWGLLRGVLADGQAAGMGLGGELVAEAGEVLEIGMMFLSVEISSGRRSFATSKEDFSTTQKLSRKYGVLCCWESERVLSAGGVGGSHQVGFADGLV